MKGKDGSMILSCMFFMSIITLIMMMQWQSQAALSELTALRVQTFKKRQAVQALLEYGIALCKKDYTALTDIAAQQPIILTFNNWPVGGDTYQKGILEIMYAEQYVLTARIENIAVSCRLSRDSDHKKVVYSISAWKSV